jgi:hypothetical protein
MLLKYTHMDDDASPLRILFSIIPVTFLTFSQFLTDSLLLLFISLAYGLARAARGRGVVSTGSRQE